MARIETRGRLRCERGSHFVELAIGLPFFLALIFSMFDVARLCLGQTAVRSGVYHAARRAVGHRRPNHNDYIDSLFAQGNTTSSSSLDHHLFKTPGGDSSYYRQHAPAELYRPEVLSLAYAYVILARSFGNIRYPCTDRPDCAACTPMRDQDPAYLSLFCADPSDPATCSGGPDTQYSVRYLGLRCTINVPIVSLSVFYGWFPESYRITSTVYVPMENHSIVQFDPND